MRHLIICSDALSNIDMANVRDLNREHHPVTITVVESSGYSLRYKLKEEYAEKLIKDVPPQYYIRR